MYNYPELGFSSTCDLVKLVRALALFEFRLTPSHAAGTLSCTIEFRKHDQRSSGNPGWRLAAELAEQRPRQGRLSQTVVFPQHFATTPAL